MAIRFPIPSALQSRDFALYCGARFISALAVQMLNVAVGWWVYALTHDPFALGLVGLAVFLPAIGLALVTGHVADRFNRLAILRICYAVATLAAAGLLFYAASGARQVAPIYALLLLFGVARAFANPAGQAIVPNLVPPAHLGSAIAWNALVWQTATIAGPALGGILYLFGATVVFAAVAFSYGITFGLLAGMRHRAIRIAPEPTTWSHLLAGIHFIRSKPVVFGAISLDLFAVLLGGATALLPVYAHDILHVGPEGLGLLRSMPAVGAVLMASWLAYRPLRRHTGRRLFQAVFVFGLATLGFGLSKHLALSLACLFVLGAVDMVSVFIRQTLVQVETPDVMRGRVSAVNTVFIGASNELGEFESGALAALIGTVPTVVAGGIGTWIIAALWLRWFPALRDRDRLGN
ncbi:MAG: MFS transporter [Candidatus Competibacteraceae bacterium]|nr:MFS transporter [Candidatus Competibacteraceae bacterium]